MKKMNTQGIATYIVIGVVLLVGILGVTAYQVVKEDSNTQYSGDKTQKTIKAQSQAKPTTQAEKATIQSIEDPAKKAIAELLAKECQSSEADIVKLVKDDGKYVRKGDFAKVTGGCPGVESGFIAYFENIDGWKLLEKNTAGS